MALLTSHLDRFARVLASEVGYMLQPENEARLARILSERAAVATGGRLEDYLSLISTDSPAAAAEWQEVLRELTIGESFFFRDAQQFALLRDTLLPRLIERRAHQRTLRVWSAGCSTGEEAYSIAIAVRELLPASAGWDISIVGTDVNKAALEQAREAVYMAWSLRALTPEQRDSLFTKEDGQFRLRPEYRQMVSFQHSNLVKDRIPSFARGLHTMDLILCRNVFIYFDAQTTALVVGKLAQALAPGGFLMTGHAELQGQHVAMLRTHVMPGSVIHERPPFDMSADGARPSLGAAASAPSRPTEAAAPPGRSAARFEDARAAFGLGEYDRAVDAVDAHLQGNPADTDALRLAAVASANLGQHARAARYCRRLLDVRPHDIEARYLLAKLAEDDQDEEAARDMLAQVIADAPSFVPAYLDLAWLEHRRGDAVRAQNLREEALQLLQRLPPKTILSSYEGLTAGDLLAQLQPSTKPAEGGE